MFLSLLLTALLTARAETPEEIIERARETQQVENAIQQMRMVLVSRSGTERSRELEMRTRRDGEILSSYARFSHPADVAARHYGLQRVPCSDRIPTTAYGGSPVRLSNESGVLAAGWDVSGRRDY